MSRPYTISERGFTIVEVLVALIVMSVGIVGIGALQIQARRANYDGIQHATATRLADALIERMRANPMQLTIYTDGGLGRTITSTPLDPVDCSASCNTSQMAAFDLYVWQRSLLGQAEQRSGTFTAGLVSPTVCVSGPAGGSGTYQVALAWRGQSALSNPTVDTCGDASGLYNDTEGTANLHRRVMVVQTYVAETI